MSLAELQDIPHKRLLLLTGSPGAGKSTFCQQIAIKGIAAGIPVIFVSTERTAIDLISSMKERGLGEVRPDSLGIIDAYTQTVGMACASQGNTLCANCADLNSLSIAVTKLRGRLNGERTWLVFDSLTSPYLFNRHNVHMFMQQFLAKYAMEGNAVVAAMDEGCGNESDLGAMMSVADGIVRMEMKRKKLIFQVIKHPNMPPSNFEKRIAEKFSIDTALEEIMDPDFMSGFMRSFFFGRTVFRPRLGDFVNAFWPKLAYWSAMLWDPQGFPGVIYEHNREDQSATGSDLFVSVLPLPIKMIFWAISAQRKVGLFPKDFSRVADMKRVWWWRFPYAIGSHLEKTGKIEYLPAQSKENEHYYRIYESSDCWGFEGVGSTIASYLPPAMAGHLFGLEATDRIWNAIETQCIGCGDPYCVVKLVPGESDELGASLVKDADAVSRIYSRLIDNLTAHLVEGKLLTNRPKFGSDVHLQIPFHTFGFAHISGDRSQMAMRMGGAKSGKGISERLLAEGLKPDEVIQRILQSMETFKAGIVTAAGGKIKIEENIEPLRTKYMTHLREPSCYFTTGFLNGIYGGTHGLRVKETRCLAAGDPHCEWEIV